MTRSSNSDELGAREMALHDGDHRWNSTSPTIRRILLDIKRPPLESLSI